MTLEFDESLGKNAKGVAVVKPGIAEAELERLTKAGICAVRIMTLHGGMLGFDVMDAVMAQVHPFGWHANIQLDGRELPKYEAQIKRLPGKFVIDHTGKFLEPVHTDSRAVSFPAEPLWIPAAAGSSSRRPTRPRRPARPKYEDVGRLAKALVKKAPERMLWASNWPHPSVPKEQRPADEDLLDLLLDWAPDENDAQEDPGRQSRGAVWLLEWR